jgi:DNA-binding SARP family transcriptional activator
MDERNVLHIASTRGEIKQGLILAQQEQYNEAVTHLRRARNDLPRTSPLIRSKLDAFIAGHDRYREAEHVLHEASEQFAAAVAEQRARLCELQRALAAPLADEIPEPEDRPHQAERGGRRPAEQKDGLPDLSIMCFGRFQVRQSGQPIPLCQSRNGQAILRYLAVQPDHRATIDMLLEALWPDESPECGKHKLYVASSALRRVLNGAHARQHGAGYLLCDNGAYALNPGAPIQIDVDDFLALYHAGRQAEDAVRVENFEAACRLHTGPVLPDDQYADWAITRREQLIQVFLAMLDALARHYLAAGLYQRAAECALRILEEDRCNETAVRQLMRTYVRAGRRHDALRQYHLCRRTLADELGVSPMPETSALYHAILSGESLTTGMPEADCFSCGRSGPPRTCIELFRQLS